MYLVSGFLHTTERYCVDPEYIGSATKFSGNISLGVINSIMDQTNAHLDWTIKDLILFPFVSELAETIVLHYSLQGT